MDADYHARGSPEGVKNHVVSGLAEERYVGWRQVEAEEREEEAEEAEEESFMCVSVQVGEIFGEKSGRAGTNISLPM
jgi:hypothetical protein